MALLLPTVQQGLEWKELRVAFKDCIKAVAPTAVVYSSWPLKYDIKKTIRLLKSDAYGGLAHAWIISINKADPYTKKAGGYNLYWDLNVRIWGFVGYKQTHDDDTQDVIEKEVRAISQIIFLNRKRLGLSDQEALSEMETVVWDDIDVHAFGDENDVHVAQGNLKLTLSETFANT